MEKSRKIIMTVLFTIVFASACGKDNGDIITTNESTMGRYVEQEIKEAGEDTPKYSQLIMGENGLYIVSKEGADLMSLDQGESFERNYKLPKWAPSYRSTILNVSITPQWDRLVSQCTEEGFSQYIALSSGDRLTLAEVPTDSICYSFYGNDGYFYIIKDTKVCRIEPQTGESTFLFEIQGIATYGASDGDNLYIASYEGIYIYDLKKQELKNQDKVLNKILTGSLITSIDGSNILIYPGEEKGELYLLTKKGLYRHVLYEKNAELIIDGSICGISDFDNKFTGMVKLKVEEENIFLILYSDGSLKKYTYDPGIASVPENMLRIYGMYVDPYVMQAITAFKGEHPEVYVKFEVGVTGEDGITVNDALKNLSTQIAAGKGPDILLMDYLPYDSYVEKGVLMDLNQLLKDSEETYFPNIIDAVKEGEHLYMVPATIGIPLLGGAEGEIENLTTLTRLADAVEAKRKEQMEGAIFKFYEVQELLRILSQSSQGAWIREDETLDREAITEYLTQAKRIYDCQMEGWAWDGWYRGGGGYGESVLIEKYNTLGFYSTAITAMDYEHQPYYADVLNGNMGYLAFLFANLNFKNNTYIMMPGLEKNVFLPSTLLAINDASNMKEEASTFVTFIMSKRFQEKTELGGFPTNIEAYYAKLQNPEPGRTCYSYWKIPNADGIEEEVKVYWPTSKEFKKLTSMIESVNKASYCDNRIYETVMEIGEKALTGEITVERAVEDIEKKMQLYLAE